MAILLSAADSDFIILVLLHLAVCVTQASGGRLMPDQARVVAMGGGPQLPPPRLAGVTDAPAPHIATYSPQITGLTPQQSSAGGVGYSPQPTGGYMPQVTRVAWILLSATAGLLSTAAAALGDERDAGAAAEMTFQTCMAAARMHRHIPLHATACYSSA
jgi:hypothetical protein